MRTDVLNTLRYHLERLPRAEDSALPHHWLKIEECMARIDLQSGSDQPLLRKLLLQLRDHLATRTWPAGYTQLVNELGRLPKPAQPSAPTEDAASPIAEVAELLAGRAVLVIGGLPRQEHAARLEQAFGLSRVYWPVTQEHNPDVGALAPEIARPDVALVLLLIRWIRHAMNDVVSLCVRHRKPLVRLPGGYNPKQVAAQILEQCGRRLDGERGPP